MYSDVEEKVKDQLHHQRKYIACTHYLETGIIENRQFPTINTNERKNLRITIFGGLFNQLFGLINGIMLAHIFKRDLYIDGFYEDPFRTLENTPIGRTFNLNKLNEILTDLQFYPRVFESDDQIKWEKVSDFNIFGMYWLPLSMDVIINELYKNNLYIGMTYSGAHPFYTGSSTGGSNNQKINSVYDYILDNLPFNDAFTLKSQELRMQLGLSDNDYVAVHVRMEDDMLNFLPKYIYQADDDIVCNNLFNNYKSLLTEYSLNNKIFISTALLKKPNRYSEQLEAILKENNNLIINRNDIEVEGMYGREISGILEYLTCREAKIFIGYEISTFTNAIVTHFKLNNKKAIQLKYDRDMGKHIII